MREARTDPGDRRSLLVHALPNKFERLDSFYGEINRAIGVVLDGTSEEDLRKVIQFFNRYDAVRAELPPGKSTGRRQGRAQEISNCPIGAV